MSAVGQRFPEDSGRPHRMLESTKEAWIQRLNVAWQLRADAGLKAAEAVLRNAGITAQVLEFPQIDRTSPAARKPHAVLRVAAPDFATAIDGLRTFGLETSLAGRLLARFRSEIRLHADGVDIVVTTRDSVRAGRPLDFGSLWKTLRDGGLRSPSRDAMIGPQRLVVLPGVFLPTKFAMRVAEVALERIAGAAKPIVVDVGTGTGAIALAVAAARPDAQVLGFDISRIAVWNARLNARRLGLRNVEFHRGHLLSAVPASLRGRVALIVANLPWIAPILRMSAETDGSRWRGPPWSVRGSDEDGLGMPRQLSREARTVLEPGGAIVFEVDVWQSALLARELSTGDYSAVERGSGLVLASLRGTSA